MTAPRGNIGPDRALLEQRLRALEQRQAALEQRGNPLFAADTNGGLARPWAPVQLYPRFSVTATTVYGERFRAVDTTERILWEGNIPYLSHPRIQVTGRWGASSGTNTTRYRLKITTPLGVVTTIGTWDVALLETARKGPYDPTTVVPINAPDVPVTLTAQTLSGSGDYACHVVGCYLRSTS